MDDFGSDEDDGAVSEMIDEDDVEANKLKRKKRPSKMCEKYVKTGKCKEREAYLAIFCQFKLALSMDLFFELFLSNFDHEFCELDMSSFYIDSAIRNLRSLIFIKEYHVGKELFNIKNRFYLLKIGHWKQLDFNFKSLKISCSLNSHSLIIKRARTLAISK